MIRRRLSIILLLCLTGIQTIAMKRVLENKSDSPSKRRKLSFAIESGDFNTTTNLLQNFNQFDFDSDDVILSISMSDFTQQQKIDLFEQVKGADFTAVDPEAGTTPLHAAVEKNEPEVAQYLLYKKRIDPNILDSNDCAPWLFVTNIKMADILWKAGADTNAKDTYGRTLLHLMPNNEQLVRYALIHGTEFSKDYRGRTPKIPGIKDEESARKLIIEELSTKFRKPISTYALERSSGQEKRLLSHIPYEENTSTEFSESSSESED